MRISDWSSDVCSSDLSGIGRGAVRQQPVIGRHDIRHARGRTLRVREGGDDLALDADRLVVLRVAGEGGRIATAGRSERGGFGISRAEQALGGAWWGDRGSQYVKISVGAESLKKK